MGSVNGQHSHQDETTYVINKTEDLGLVRTDSHQHLNNYEYSVLMYIESVDLNKAPQNNTSVSDYIGSQNRVGRSEFFWGVANFFLVDSSPYGRIFLLYVNISFGDFFPKK